MSFASLSFPAELTPTLRNELERVCAQLTEWQKANHNDDGTHSNIVATGTITERGRTAAMGVWTDVPYSAANFTGFGAMTWTVDAADQITYRYMFVGDTMFVDVYLDATSVGGVVSTPLMIAIPGGFVAAKSVASGTFVVDNGATAVAFQRVLAGATKIEVARVDLANFTACANLTYVRVQMSFGVVRS
jgi:hypothetical protein